MTHTGSVLLGNMKLNISVELFYTC